MNIRPILAATAAVVLLAGCAEVYGPGYYGPGPVADVDYDGFYDGYYGPLYDGYWGDNGVFFYRTAEGSRWRRGDAVHFRHDAASGFNHIHGTAHAMGPRQAHHRD